jgi:sugar (pentulose or hexulose) kinase
MSRKQSLNEETELNIITVDLGTSSVRVGLVSPSLKILDLIQFPVDLITNAQGKAEQDANEIINATLVALTKFSIILKPASQHRWRCASQMQWRHWSALIPTFNPFSRP